MSVPAIEGVPVECCKVCHGVTPGPAANDYTAVTAYARAYAIIEHGYCMCAPLDVEHIMASVTGHSTTFPPEPARVPVAAIDPAEDGALVLADASADGAVAMRPDHFTFATPAPGLGEFYAQMGNTDFLTTPDEAKAQAEKLVQEWTFDPSAASRRAREVPHPSATAALDLRAAVQAPGAPTAMMTPVAQTARYDGPLPPPRDTETTGPHYYPQLSPEALDGISAPPMTVYGGEIPPDHHPEGSGVRHFLDRARSLFKGHNGPGHHQAPA